MNKSEKFKSLSFTTARLEVSNLGTELKLEQSRADLLPSIVCLLSPNVVSALPPYFHGITTNEEANIWLNKMVVESHLFVIALKESNSVIGFMFLYESAGDTAHLGYLLGECSWNKGFGSEMLLGLIKTCRSKQLVNKLIAGVDSDNFASIKLLEKVGFVANPRSVSSPVFYEYCVT